MAPETARCLAVSSVAACGGGVCLAILSDLLVDMSDKIHVLSKQNKEKRLRLRVGAVRRRSAARREPVGARLDDVGMKKWESAPTTNRGGKWVSEFAGIRGHGRVGPLLPLSAVFPWSEISRS